MSDRSRSSRGRLRRRDPEGGAGVASTAARNRGYETPGAAPGTRSPGGVEPSHRIRQQCRRRKWSLGRQRHGGAPRGGVPVARDGPCLASVVSRAYERDVFKAGASRRSAAVTFKPMNYQYNLCKVADIPGFFPVRWPGHAGWFKPICALRTAKRLGLDRSRT